MSSRLISFFFFYMLPRPPTSTLFPYTTLFRSQRITTPFHIYKSVIIPNGLYHFARHQLTYGSRQDRRFTYSFFERFGGYYGGKLNEFRVRANYRPTARFSASLIQTWNRFRLPQGDFSVDLASLQGNYSFSRFLTLSSTIQMDTAN